MMSLKELKLDLEALLSQVINGKGYLHYGYWKDLDPMTASLADVGIAQQHYFDLFSAHLPSPPASILDVGSGTGANARELQLLGYEVECLCPSARLNALARAKLSADTPIYETVFEDFKATRHYDALLFAESFHYIGLQQAVRQIDQLNPRVVIIFDYFSRADQPLGQDQTRRPFAEVMRCISEGLQQYQVELNLDATADIAPTFDVLSRLNQAHVAPFVEQLKLGIRQRRPILGRLINRVIGALYRGERDCKKPARSDVFQEKYEYRLVVLTRIAG